MRACRQAQPARRHLQRAFPRLIQRTKFAQFRRRNLGVIKSPLTLQFPRLGTRSRIVADPMPVSRLRSSLYGTEGASISRSMRSSSGPLILPRYR